MCYSYAENLIVIIVTPAACNALLIKILCYKFYSHTAALREVENWFRFLRQDRGYGFHGGH